MKKTKTVSILNLKKMFAVAMVGMSLLASSSVFATGGTGSINFWGGYSTQASQDITKPVPDRSYFVTSVEEIAGGAKLIVEIYHGKLDSKVSLYLQAAINDGNGNVDPIPFKQLDNQVADNPTNYYSKREFILKYADLNAELAPLLPAGAKHLTIGPGTPLFVFAQFHEFNHQWGSIGRGGIFFMPEAAGVASTAGASANAPARRADELDLAYPIPENMAFKYNDVVKKTGLQVGGQIRSRLESEGKYQIPQQDLARVKKHLFDLANNPAEAQKVLGPDWTITPLLKYMLKDPNDPNKLLLDKNGLPTPDPMVDTYYDNDNFDAAKNDMAIRYRWTEGNGTGAWNFKPGLDHVTKDGIVDRLEYGADTTDDKPDTIKKFADSTDPLNFFGLIREIVPGSTPSDFLKPSVKVQDTRYKFLLEHKNGLKVEVSLDDVKATSLRSKHESQYSQMEMDIDHLSTASQNVATNANGFSGLSGTVTPAQQTFLAALDGKAFLDGRPGSGTREPGQGQA